MQRADVRPSVTRLSRALRACASCGAIGVVGFVAAWAIGGALRADYSAVDDAISRLAQSGTPRRWIMNGGFVAFGLGVCLYALALRRALGGVAWISVAVSGLATLVVAAAPLGTANMAHNVAATIGYAALAATPVLAAGAFHAADRTVAARISLATGLVSAFMLAVSTADALHGLTQRVGLGVVDLWIVATAMAMTLRGRLIG